MNNPRYLLRIKCYYTVFNFKRQNDPWDIEQPLEEISDWKNYRRMIDYTVCKADIYDTFENKVVKIIEL